MNFYKDTGELVIGSRLKRLSEKFLMDVAKVYDALDLDFEISWFPLFYLLSQKGSLTVTEIARELEITHSAVSQIVTILQKRGLVQLGDHKDDKRKKNISFTKEGKKLLKKVEPVWASITRVFSEVLRKGEYSNMLLAGLSEIEDNIKNHDLKKLVLEDRERALSGIPEIIEYDKKYEHQYKKFLLDWIIDKEKDEIEGTELLSSPDEIVKNGSGIIKLAGINEVIVGIAVSRSYQNREAEILIILVDEEWQNRKIGSALIEELILDYGKLKYKKISAVVNKAKVKAVKVLRDCGFVLGNMKSVRDNNNRERIFVQLEYKIDK